jgi:tetratricopeptide (TPR) repeat protein
LGHRALGKAAKIVRKDDEMVQHYLSVLQSDPSAADVHFDLALVYHGRPGGGLAAAEHYRRVLEINPTHPRRRLIESWVQDLSLEEGASK